MAVAVVAVARRPAGGAGSQSSLMMGARVDRVKEIKCRVNDEGGRQRAKQGGYRAHKQNLAKDFFTPLLTGFFRLT